MMSFGNDVVSRPITAKGVSVAIRSCPKSQKNQEVHVGVRRALRGARRGVPPRGRCCQGVPMCPSPFKRTPINWALHHHTSNPLLQTLLAHCPPVCQCVTSFLTRKHFNSRPICSYDITWVACQQLPLSVADGSVDVNIEPIRVVESGDNRLRPLSRFWR